MFTAMSLIFVNSVFVKAVGGKNYSQLFFFASLASVIYYFYFALLGDRKGYGVYKAFIALTLFASILCFMEQYFEVLVPYNHIFLYIFAISTVLVDLIGTTLGPVVLQLSVNPAIFREVYGKIITADLVARITASGIIWVLSANHWLGYWYPIGWVCLIIHFLLFNETVARLKRVETKSGIKKDEAHVLERIRKGVKFIFSNDMVRIAMTIMIWSQVTKFVVEYVFYQAADMGLPSARRIALFVSSTTMVAIMVSLAMQFLVGRRLTRRLQLSTLFGFQPLNILLFSGLALILPPFWPVVILLVTFNVINRSIQLPVSRQCLVPVPRSQRSTIVSLICIFMSSATMVASGTMAALKEVLHFQDFLVVLLVLGAVVLFIITGLDSYYIRNLWSFYREARSGRWQDEPVVDNLSEVELESSAGSLDADGLSTPTADLKSHPVLETYATSLDRKELAAATDEHRELVSSNKPHHVLLGLRICFVTGFPWFRALWNRALSHDSRAVRDFAEIAIRVDNEFKGIEGYSSVFVRRIRGLALEFLEDSLHLHDVSKLQDLLKTSDHNAAESLVATLSDSRFRHLRGTLLECILEGGEKLTLEPIVKRMFESDYETAHHCREVLAVLSFGKNSKELRDTIETNLASFSKERLALGAHAPETSRDSDELRRFMHTLFVEEYRLCPHEVDRALTDSIREFPVISQEDKAMLVDMHLEFLKRSDLFRRWQSLMA
jgi:hypothetical protein